MDAEWAFMGGGGSSAGINDKDLLPCLAEIAAAMRLSV